MNSDGDFIGEIQLSASESIIFSISRWKSEYGLNIRKHIDTYRYSGPTKQGIRIHKKGLYKILDCLTKTALERSKLDQPILGVIAKSADIDIVIQISSFSGMEKLDIRETINSKDQSYFTKKGLSIPVERVNDLKVILEEAKWAFENNYPDQ
jgi:Transcriptional Coactivator p15 (PC4)